MRYIKLFLLYAQDVFVYRSILIVWFLVSIINPLLYLLFWRGAITTSNTPGFRSLSDVNSYYFLYLILGGFLMAHIEHEVAYWDIKEGGLIKYILKPMSYITFKFFLEFTWRIAMGVLMVVSIIILTMMFGHILTLSLTPFQIGLAIGVCLLAFLISFVFKMIVGLSALWVVDFSGIEQVVFVASLLFSGYVVPLDMSPRLLQFAAHITPFPWILYYPIRLIQGKLSSEQTTLLILTQIGWLILLCFAYKFVWQRGARRFTGVGL